MILKLKTLITGLLVVYLLIFFVSHGSCANELTSVNDVDMIDVVAYKKSDTILYVSFLYKNYKNDQLVFWRNTSSDVSCNVYELLGTGRDKQKGRNIGSGKNSLNSFSQGIYIDIVTTKEEWGLADCGWTFGGKNYYGKGEFLQRKSY